MSNMITSKQQFIELIQVFGETGKWCTTGWCSEKSKIAKTQRITAFVSHLINPFANHSLLK